MKKHVLIASIIGGLTLAPVAVFAADNSMSKEQSGASGQMKGPPNANGAQQGRSDSETNANAPKAGGDNGAAAAKATGEADGKMAK